MEVFRRGFLIRLRDKGGFFWRIDVYIFEECIEVN